MMQRTSKRRKRTKTKTIQKLKEKKKKKKERSKRWAVSSYCITAALHKEDVVGCVCFGRSKHCGTAAAHTSKKFHVVFCNHLRLKLNAL